MSSTMIQKPKPKFGWPPTTASSGFAIGKRVKWMVPIAGQNRFGMYTGIFGTIIDGTGLPSKVPGSKGGPSWTILWDNGYKANFFEWALELV